MSSTLDKLSGIDIALEKAFAILSVYRNNAYLDEYQLTDDNAMMLKVNHKENGLLFYSAQDYLGKAIEELEKVLNEA